MTEGAAHAEAHGEVSVRRPHSRILTTAGRLPRRKARQKLQIDVGRK